MRRLYPLIIVLVLLLGSLFIVFNSSGEPTQSTSTSTPVSSQAVTPVVTDFTAHFAIFTRGTFRIFTDSRYHNLNKEIFIDSAFPNSVNVKKENVTWGEFFATLPMKLQNDCLMTGTGQTFCTTEREKLAFYLNGIEDPAALDKKISPGDRLLITYGNQNAVIIQGQLERLAEISEK